MGKPLEIKEGTVFGHYAFFPHRFRKVDDDWVEELLCKLIEEVETDELVHA